MMLYKVHISSVDGETFFSCGGRASTVLDFLRLYDHEGSGVSLEIWTSAEKNAPPPEILDSDPTLIYDRLALAAAEQKVEGGR